MLFPEISENTNMTPKNTLNIQWVRDLAFKMSAQEVLVLLCCKSTIKRPPPPRAYLLQAHLRGALIETGSLFNLETTTVSVLHTELV